MRILFTGHRNRFANPADLEKVAADYPGATWMHGGAIGLDSQVDSYARAHGKLKPSMYKLAENRISLQLKNRG